MEVHAQPSDYIGYWKFDADLMDSSIYQNNGTGSDPNFTADRRGNPLSSILIEGQTDHLNLGNTGVLDNTWNSFSISIWVKIPSGLTSHHSIVSKGISSGYNNFNLSIEPDGKVRFWFSDTNMTTSISTITDGMWHHIVAVWNGSDNLLYIDNNMETTIPNNPNITKSGQPILLGTWKEDSSWAITGEFDDLQFYNRTLNESEISVLYGTSEGYLNGWQKIDNDLYYSSGSVAVGTNNIPDGYDLAVDGKIVSQEVKVSLDVWPDFVFHEEYNLTSIKDLERFINQHKHLPSIPAEKEVLENGINLGEINSKLLQKIEELTLYIIHQNKEIELLKERVKMIEKR